VFKAPFELNEFVPVTVMDLPLSPGAGMKPIASPLGWIWGGAVLLISLSNQFELQVLRVDFSKAGI
jgi:hypothetical protein